ncbi:MAG: GDP-mannose 4,6-dehydratase [Bacteroidetes bacterium]|nr:GDP-mannose 4,6-dehydratase [Bacteroidota bacterium]MBS1973561.1 GDP-mannose 4,6-dehydratase [Bacteroidota bacterium]
MTNAIIFGSKGQDGHYLAKLLQQQPVNVIGIHKVLSSSDIDITSYPSVRDLIKNQQPDFVFHLAANSTTKHETIFENHEIIATGTLNILEAVKNFSPRTKVFISGSGLQFKNNGHPIKETAEFEARDAYSVSRIHSVYAARYYRSLGIKTYIGYFFNHDSPRRTERHIAKKIAEAAKRISKGSPEKIEIGDAGVIKEWTFAGDVVKGVWTLVTQDNLFEANIGSGIGYSIDDWIKACFSIIKKKPEEHIQVKKGFRPEYQQLVCDPALINSLGWKPTVSFEQLAEMMMKE